MLISICVSLVLLCLNLLVMCYIFVRYILRLKIKSRLVILFYVFAFLTTAFRCIQTVSVMDTVNHKIMDINYIQTIEDTEHVSENLANVFTVCMGLIIVATMYKIAISIQMLLLQVTKDERVKRKTRFYIFLVVVLCFVIAEFVLVYALPDLNIYSTYLINIFNYASMSVLFTLVMTFLLSKLDKMNGDELNSERKTMFN